MGEIKAASRIILEQLYISFSRVRAMISQNMVTLTTFI